MRKTSINRRGFLLSSIPFLLSSRGVPISASSPASTSQLAVEVNLIGRASDLKRETVNFGLPLPLGLLFDSKQVAVVNSAGEEIPSAIRSLEPWRIGGISGSIRSLQIQFTSDFTVTKTNRIKVIINRTRKKKVNNFVPVAQTLMSGDESTIPRVIAVLPAEWMCNSLIVGPQTPTEESGNLSDYDRLVERNFPGSLQFINSKVYHEWLFDRTSVWYKMYVRTGDIKYLEAAYRAAHFVRLHTKMDGADAGIFTLKGVDLKYVYPRAMHIHYLLTGDERALAAGKVMAQFCLKNHDPVYRPVEIKPVPTGVDPEKEREFWTLRHQGYGVLGILHGWEMTGDKAFYNKAVESVDAYYKHQMQPPDGYPPDGSLRQDWELYDPNEAVFKGATSAWMMTLLLDPLFHYWTLTGDKRVPEIVLKWCDFLDAKGMIPDGTKAYYVINCFRDFGAHRSEPGTIGPDMEMHNAEIAYTFAMGMFFAKPRAERWMRYKKRFDKLFELATALNVNRPARAFNWTFQFSSQLIYFVRHSGQRLETLKKYQNPRVSGRAMVP